MHKYYKPASLPQEPSSSINPDLCTTLRMIQTRASIEKSNEADKETKINVLGRERRNLVCLTWRRVDGQKNIYVLSACLLNNIYAALKGVMQNKAMIGGMAKINRQILVEYSEKVLYALIVLFLIHV